MLLQSKQAQEATAGVPQPKTSPRETVRGILTGRGEEVLETARRRYPREIAVLEQRIAEAIQAGRLNGPVSGEELYSFLRSIGLGFSMDIKIRVAEKGKFKTLEEKFREREY